MFAAPVQQRLYTAATPYTALVLQWCIPVLPAYLLLQVYGSLLTAMAQLKSFLIVLCSAVVINVLLNVWLIPRWGAVGCCIAALVSQYICALAVYLFATTKNGLRHDSRQLGHLAATALVLGGFFYAGRTYMHPLVAAGMGGGVVLLALFAYLPHLKRTFILSR